MIAFYNENDSFAADWLERLIEAGHISPGRVERKSIKELSGAELEGFNRVHLFAGIGGWDYALQLAGWPADRPVWTGSCPCQDYSVAGKAEGVEGSRDLWPDMFRLVAEQKPSVVFGEQVKDAIAHGWMDRLQSDLEGIGYAVGFAVLPAYSFGTNQVRERIYWVGADAEAFDGHSHDRVDAGRARRTSKPVRGLACVEVAGRWWQASKGAARLPTLVRNHHGLSKVLAGFGNAIVPQVAAEFIRAFMECQA